MKANIVVTVITLGLAWLGGTGATKDFDANDYYVLHLDAGTSPDQVATRLGLTHDGPLGELRDHHLFSAKPAAHDLVKRELHERRLKKRSGDWDVLDGIRFSQKQQLRKPWEKRIIPFPPAAPLPDLFSRQEAQPVDWAVKKQADVARTLNIQDPTFSGQWHLYNPVQIGHDVNVTECWLQGVTGKNATVAIVDDGLDFNSGDLHDNYYAAGSYDFNDKDEDPLPELSDDRHGTRCAGEVSAVRNDVCGVGVAYDSKIAGIRILSKFISDADEAVAMNYDFEHNQIYSCSWGPPDDGRSMDAPGVLIRRAMLNAVQRGRNGLGSVYVFASGNGASVDDNCNFDGYTNSIYSITVGAIDRTGQHPYYSEKCSASLVVTYSSGAGDAIHTTDVGANACYENHGGTSAAAPLAAGIFALALQVRPDLTWRDMQYIAMRTAVPINLDMPDEWQTTTIGLKYSHTFAYGKLDSYALVEAAKTWKNVKPQTWLFSPWIHVNEAIPQGGHGIMVSLEVTPDMIKDANLERIEHVTVTMNINHTRRGDLSVDLVSPNKVVSHISTARRLDEARAGYDDWTFMSVVHWGESGLGTWTVIVKDEIDNEHNGTFIDWHLKLWGESKDPSKTTLLPLPTDEDDKDHLLTMTTTIGATTTTLAPNPAATLNTSPPPLSTPSDHPDRPVNSKPTGTEGDNPEQTGAPEEGEQTDPNKSSSWLPSFLPTFGAGPRTQIWIYGALALIIVFCVGLGIWLFLVRRKRLRNDPRGEYEFELLEDEEGEGLNGNSEKAGLVSGASGNRSKKTRRTRGEELYNAFAGSDEEDEAAEYRDGSDERLDKGEKVQRRSLDDGEEQHVIGEDSDEEDEGEASRPLARQ